ncbi:CDP-diacylglycerol--glycerol-3-phosphate 3-phosphatidyltransferase [Pseudooceanicola sp. 502str34]|uniref:CDP-diacylglycerol--glycerol-3-phosphate 3-phosphatidyltransferase n=1 Tax=Maritimibacter alkaliphilus TaxID=404236 RepID=UPI001C954D6D|nr:CDP-diacylglycerol--glycerol-3-phosphate 3-phosphatidyltransferase [Maritimibacter alkaliphilus]MBY6090232.1 CDP-diacylglycerol--glycerol-3-phosphate 3-phosphatidyltransferase [Maritimibacter alkaliphilus]
MTLTVPNILTILRLIAAPAIAIIYLAVPRPAADIIALVVFGAASATDWFDGHLARKWKQVSKLGTMLDPIADKAMVVVALMVLARYSPIAPWIILPAAVILFREVFVSGLREYLGDVAGVLKVTPLAKWKTASQMVAIALLLANGAFWALTERTGSIWADAPNELTAVGGGILIWVAAALTAITGWDYFAKAKPYLEG